VHLSYRKMCLMALPYTIALSVTGALCIVYIV
jgi:Na+/H+ antiporter NhaB